LSEGEKIPDTQNFVERGELIEIMAGLSGTNKETYRQARQVMEHCDRR
jgi:hypothetical protein